MNKYSMLVFILILSLILPFFPCFSYVLMADNNISVSVNVGDYDSWSDGIRDKSQGILGKNGYAVNPNFYSDDLDFDSFWNWFMGPMIDIGFTVDDNSGIPLSRQIYDYSVENNIDVDAIINDNDTSLVNYVNNQCPYYVYRTMPVSTFFQYFIYSRPDSDGMRELANFKNWVVPLVNSLDGISVLYVDGYIMARDTRIIHLGNLLDNYSLALSSGTFGDFPNLEYQTVVYNGGPESQIPNPKRGSLNLYSNSDFLPYDGYYANYNPWAGTVSNNTTVNFCYVGAVQDGMYASWHCYFNGSLYLTPDSVGSVSFIVFRSSADMQLFMSGRSPVYQFNPSVDFGDKAGDINFGDLYNFLSNNIDFSLGDISAQINGLANDYLEEQLKNFTQPRITITIIKSIINIM